MKMEETLQRFIDEKEECLIYSANNMLLIARIVEIGDGWIRIDEKDSESIVNLANVYRIRSYPKNEKGKKKSIF